MTDADKAYFEMINEKAKTDEHVRCKAAADYLVRSLTSAAKTEQGIDANLLCIVLSTFTGIAVADCAKTLFEQNKGADGADTAGAPMVKLETKAGIFWSGDLINSILFGKQYSVWNIVMSGYSVKKGKEAIPNLQEMVTENAKIMGNPDVLLWAGTTNPYIEAGEAKPGFYGIKRRLEPFGLADEEYPQAFALALCDVIMKVDSVFPPELSSAKVAMEFVMFVSHMDLS